MEENNKSLILVNNSLAKIEKQISIGEKILGISMFNNDRLKIKTLFLKYSKKDNFSIKLISHFYLFDLITIEKNVELLDWIYISSNKNINWDEEMIEKFKNHLNWGRERGGDSKRYCYGDKHKKYDYYPDSKLSTDSFSSNSKIKWTLQAVEKYKDKIDWDSFARNARIPWTKGIKEKYGLKGIYLSQNIFLPWSEFLLKTEDGLWVTNTSSNPSIPWTVEIVKNTRDVNFYRLFMNEGIKWSETIFWQILKICEERTIKEDKGKVVGLCWLSISENKKFPWTEKFIEENNNKLSWGYYRSETIEGLNSNEGLPWTEKFVEKYLDKWNWIFLSKNSKLPWSEDFIIKYSDNWDWDNLSGNQGLPWSENLISEHIEKWNWKKLSQNPNLPWSLDFFEKYSNKWDFNILLFNKGFYKIFETTLDDTLVNEIITEISAKE